MLHNMRRTAAGLFAAALAIAALASASSTHKISAALNAKQEVPKQVVKVPGAMGSFSGSIEGGKQATLRWKLTFSGLSGKPTAAHIHLGKRGVSGNVLVPLCSGNCRSGMTGTATLSPDVVDEIERGQTYVNVHTKKNPNGEIRGQVILLHR